MISFVLSLLALFLGYQLYGRFVARIFAPDDRSTPAVAKADGVDYIVLPSWKVFMIQFLNIAGTGPIFGAIMGMKFGPAAYLWIVFGCIFAGAVHDYFCGMLSMRNGGASQPEIVGKYMGKAAQKGLLIFSVVVLLFVGTVYVYSPALILGGLMGGTQTIYWVWIIAIFVYYTLATMLPIDKIIGRFYPIFGFAILFMAVALCAVLFIKWPSLPEVWDIASTPNKDGNPIVPCLFITIACGAISGFHSTQAPLMARCLADEHKGRAIFYGSMITEGVVALIWCTVSSWFFYGGGAAEVGLTEAAQAPEIVTHVSESWLGLVGGILAILGVVAAPITSGDTAFRSARLIIADFFHFNQKPIANRLAVSVPLFAITMALLWFNMENEKGFNTIWSYFGWSNQTLACCMLWTITVYLARLRKPFWIALLPALFMTFTCSAFLFVFDNAFDLGTSVAYVVGSTCVIIGAVWFFWWYFKHSKTFPWDDVPLA